MKKQLVLAMAAVLACASLVPAQDALAYAANLGFDPLDIISLRGEWTTNFTEVRMLDLDGQWKTVPAVKTSEGTLQLQLPLAAHRVAIFRFL